ncbi:hypothetical protein [Candidatus Chloroploca asiatica]|uniref:Uncharacterized protein n=1 Tax=Candidatus Chloroploca asiatica TaxID=1506545 RepID=A0A2H3L9S5_9CHLR|nr:hypothetical protein [Candidatus Chloroploca asiatica]PDV99086.1 hypothetical protein A9Q02_13465 [Candidatus Chloroploca asiatica]
MISSLPVSQLAPLDYRYAIDGALALLGNVRPLVRCEQPELDAELAQRLPVSDYMQHTIYPSAALWIEPQQVNWQQVLNTLATTLPPGTQLAIIASQPLARLLPDRQTWRGVPIGIKPGGITRLGNGLRRAGFYVQAKYGIHSVYAIGLNSLGGLMTRIGRADLRDRLEFAARLGYMTHGVAMPLATVALVLACKKATVV